MKEVVEMNRTCVILLILFLILGGYSCGRSSEKPKGEQKVMEKKKSLVEEAFEEEPKAPPEAIVGAEGGVILEEEFASPPE